MFPPRSRTCAVSTVSPNGSAFGTLTRRQNCTTPGDAETNAGWPNASTVQARPPLVATANPQPKSFRASVTCWVRLKSAGSNPGIPPPVHTAGSPSPSGREASICKSGRTSGSPGLSLNTEVPTASPLPPGTASTIRRNPAPASRWKTRVPSGSSATGEMLVPSAPASPRNTTRGPAAGVGLGCSKRISPTTSPALTTPSLFTSAPGHSRGATENLPAPANPAPSNSCDNNAETSRALSRPSQFTSPVSAPAPRLNATTSNSRDRGLRPSGILRAKSRATMPAASAGVKYKSNHAALAPNIGEE